MRMKRSFLCGLATCAVSGCSSLCPPSADVDPVEAAWAVRANVPRERIEWVNVWIEDAEKPIPGVTEGVPGGTVELRRLLVVFHGGRVVCREEV